MESRNGVIKSHIGNMVYKSFKKLSLLGGCTVNTLAPQLKVPTYS